MANLAGKSMSSRSRASIAGQLANHRIVYLQCPCHVLDHSIMNNTCILAVWHWNHIQRDVCDRIQHCILIQRAAKGHSQGGQHWPGHVSQHVRSLIREQREVCRCNLWVKMRHPVEVECERRISNACYLMVIGSDLVQQEAKGKCQMWPAFTRHCAPTQFCDISRLVCLHLRGCDICTPSIPLFSAEISIVWIV